MRIVSIFVALVLSTSVAGAAMSGWSDEAIDELSSVISKSLVSGAREGYYQRAEEVGDTNPKPFPENEVKKSFDVLSLCILNIASEKWTYDEFINSQGVYMRQLLNKALKGGECKPTGLVGEATEARRRRTINNSSK